MQLDLLKASQGESAVAYELQSQIVIHRDRDVLLGTEVPFRRLDGAVPQQELDLLEITASFAA